MLPKQVSTLVVGTEELTFKQLRKFKWIILCQ